MNKTRIRKFLSYYKPYQKLFWADMACAFIVSAISLIIPMITRYITNTVLASEQSFQVEIILKLGMLPFSSPFSNFKITSCFTLKTRLTFCAICITYP